jgi:peptidoglycan hydrolase-like protein with peptidoglycan-binding domain
MRFKEFKTILEKRLIDQEGSTGYYTVGDSHAVGLANYTGKPWINKGKNGMPSTEPMHFQAIDSIPKGSVVLISVGANDTFAGAGANPQTIAGNVSKVVNAAKAKGLKVTYLLFPIGTRPNAELRQKAREAIKQVLDVPIVDLEGSRLVDGVHADAAGYKKASAQVLSGAKPSTSIGVPDAEPGAPATKDRIQQSSNLEQGPPFPPEQKDDVMKMQQSLQDLGYSVGRLGVDGKYGPATAAAVTAFKKDYKLDGSGSSFSDKEFTMLSQIQSGQVAKVKEPTKTEFGGYSSAPMADLQMDAVTKGRVGEVLNLVAGPESGGDYAKMFGGKSDPSILKMTMEELTAYQLTHAKKYGSSAAGRYQIMHFNTLNYARRAGLDPKKDIFSPENQDKMGIIFLRECGLENWLNDKMTDENFLERLSRVWAGVPSPSKGGNSYYGGVGLNKARTQLKMDTALNQLDKIGSATA